MIRIWFAILSGCLCLAGSTAAQETVFDRKVQIIDTLMEVPVVPRLEESLHMEGHLELVGDVNLWVEQIGTGTPLVLVSGGPGTSHHYFHPHFQEAARFSRLTFYDLRGVGLSDPSPDELYSMEQAVDDLDLLRQKLGIDRWVVLGLSFGGAIAQVYALNYPEHLLGLVLVSSALPMSIDIGLGSRQYTFQSEEERARIAEIYTVNGERAIPVHSDQVTPAMQRKMLFNAFMNGDWKRRHLQKWTERDIAMYARYEFVHARNYYTAMLQDYFTYDLTDLFLSCPIPTLIFEGNWDMAFSADKAQIMFDQFPKADHQFFEQSGHIPYEDEPERFMAALEQFLRDLEAPAKRSMDRWISQVAEADFRRK